MHTDERGDGELAEEPESESEAGAEQKNDAPVPGLMSRSSGSGQAPKTRASTRLMYLKWGSLIVVLSLFTAANWPYQYRPTLSGAIEWSERPYDLGFGEENALQPVDPVEAGWPFRYYISHTISESDRHSQFLVLSLISNLVIAVLVVVLVFGYLTLKQMRSASLSLQDLILGVTIIAAVFAYWHLLGRQVDAEQAIADELTGSGSVVWQSFLPEVFASRIPDALRNKCSRITAVMVREPSDEQIELIGRLPYLRSLRIGGGYFDETPLQRLPSMRYLQDVRIAGMELDPATILALSDCSMMRQLNVSYTNCAEASLSYFEQAPRLTHLMAMGTLVPLEAWQQTGLRNRLETLVISRPKSGDAGKIRLAEWNNLRRVTITSLEEPVNPNVFQISLHNLPRLATLQMDALQLTDLDLQGLPLLEKISLLSEYSMRRLADNEERPSRLWVRKISMNDLPKMKSLEFDLRDFESMQIARCPELESVVATSKVVSGSLEERFDATVDSTLVQRLINAFGAAEGPEHFSIRGCDLTDVDLSELENNSSMRSLELRHCVLPRKLTVPLSRSAVRHLDLRDSTVDNIFVNELVARHPRLESLSITSDIRSIQVEGKPAMRAVRFRQHNWSEITSLRLVDVPEFQSPMVLSPMGNRLHVENAPKLRGLAALSDQASGKISGVPGLNWFVGGGTMMNNHSVAEVLKANELTRLTIGYPSADSEAFSRFTELRSLEQLALPGAKLADDVVKAWQIPPSLKFLDLRSCGLSAETTSRIIRRGGWHQLKLAGNQLNAQVLPELAKSPDLVELSLGGVVVDKGLASVLGSLNGLSELNLSGATIQAGGLTKIVEGARNLLEVDLTSATIDWAEIQPAIDSNRRLRFRLSPVDATVSVMDALTSNGRLLGEEDPIQAWRGRKGREFMGNDLNGYPVYSRGDDPEDLAEFECPDWSPDFFLPGQANLGVPFFFPAPNTMRGSDISVPVQQRIDEVEPSISEESQQDQPSNQPTPQ